MQLVIEFGSHQIDPIIDVIRRLVGNLLYTIDCRFAGGDANEPTDDSLETAAAKVNSGEVVAFTLRPRQEVPIRYILVLSPSIDGANRSFYLGTIEYTQIDYAPIWKLVLDTPGLTVAAVGFEEGVELDDAALHIETFPWDEWPLVVGAVREHFSHGSWTTREGPERKWFGHQ